MLGLKEKYGELKEDAGTIKKNINKLSVILENEKASVLELQKEIQNSYDLLMEKIAVSNRKEEEIKLKQDELENLRKELIERDIENKTLTQNIKTLTKDNKELQEKLYQKEQDELKFKILTNETSINIENLKKKMDEQNEEVQQYKIEIESLKDEIEKQNKTNVTSISPDIDPDQKLTINNINSLEEEIEKNPKEFKTYYLNEEKNNGDIAIEFVSQESKLDSCLTNFEKPLAKNIKDQYEKKEQKIYIDLLKESKLDINNIQEFILNRSKSIDDPEELSTNDWKKVLNFGVGYKILTNREIQQLKQISLMLGNSGYKSDRSEILNKVKKNGFEISLYKAEDWEKVLEFLVKTKGITKEVKDGFEGIFKKYKKKKMFKLEQLKFILPYLEKYKENIKKIEIESKDDFLEKEEESCLTPFGKTLNENYIEEDVNEKNIVTATANIMDSIEEKAEKNTSLIELSNENIKELNTKILTVESDEWPKIKQWLHENDILDCNHQKKVGYYNFCDVLNESKRFNKKLTTGQMIKARDLYIILEGAGYFDLECKLKSHGSEEIDSMNGIKGNENVTSLILEKFKRYENSEDLKEDEWHEILRFGVYFNLFGKTDTQRIHSIKIHSKVNGKLHDSLLENSKKYLTLVKNNGFEVSLFNLDEWNKVINHLKINDILTSNVIGEFYNISNESEETGFFSLEQLKFISPYLDKFKDLVHINRENSNIIDEVSSDEIKEENGDIEYNKIEEFKESKYDLSEKQDRVLRGLKLFSSKNWENLSIWSDNRFLIETEDIEVLDSLIDGKLLDDFEELELIGLIELYEYLVEEGFNSKDFNLEKEEKHSSILEELKLFEMEDWRKLYDWSDKKLLIQHEDHKLLAPLVNGNSIDNMEESDLINLSNLYKQLLEKGFEKKSTISEEKEIEVSEEVNPVSEDELLEEVRNFKSKDWIDMLDWAKNNKKLRTQDYNILSNLAFKSIDKGLNEKELVLGLEVYFLAKSEGFQIVKEKDVDEFLMQFVDENESVEDVQKEDKIINFKDLINKGLKNGFIEYTMLEKINYDKEIEINDHFEAIEELEDRGIVIKY